MRIQTSQLLTQLFPAIMLVIFTAAMTGGCPSQHDATTTGGTSPAASSSSSSDDVHDPDSTASSTSVPVDPVADPQPTSMFAGTPLAAGAPAALDITLGGTKLFVKENTAGTAARSVFSAFALGDDGIGERTLHFQSDLLFRSYIKAHPTADECIVASHIQAADGVVDALWVLGASGVNAIPYADTPGFPKALPALVRYNLEPFYSWDGDWIAVPLNQVGLCVFANTGSTEPRFIPYPSLPDATTGQAFGALPSASEYPLAFVSFWRVEDSGASGTTEWCFVYLLNLATGEWLQSIELSWPVYQIASTDPENMPWLARGSRYPNMKTEFKRVPRLALLDPDSGITKLQVFSGRPYWPVVLSPSGGSLAFADTRRTAIVRVNREAGVIDIDPRYFSEDVVLFLTSKKDLYCWEGDLLFRAVWSEHEQSVSLGE